MKEKLTEKEREDIKRDIRVSAAIIRSNAQQINSSALWIQDNVDRAFESSLDSPWLEIRNLIDICKTSIPSIQNMLDNLKKYEDYSNE